MLMGRPQLFSLLRKSSWALHVSFGGNLAHTLKALPHTTAMALRLKAEGEAASSL